MSYHCPNCQRAIDNRRLTHCGHCGAVIPDRLRFTPEEIAALDRADAEFQAEFARLTQLDKEWRDFIARTESERKGGSDDSSA